jgi:hypothetical protein
LADTIVQDGLYIFLEGMKDFEKIAEIVEGENCAGVLGAVKTAAKAVTEGELDTSKLVDAATAKAKEVGEAALAKAKEVGQDWVDQGKEAATAYETIGSVASDAVAEGEVGDLTNPNTPPIVLEGETKFNTSAEWSEWDTATADETIGSVASDAQKKADDLKAKALAMTAEAAGLLECKVNYYKAG